MVSRARQMKFVGHIMRIGKIEDLSLTGRIIKELHGSTKKIGQ